MTDLGEAMDGLPGITIVLVVEGQLEGGVLTALYSAEHQEYACDLNIVQAIDGVTVAEAQRVGVKNALTTWVILMGSDEDWNPDHLQKFADVIDQMPYASDITLPSLGKMWKKTYWLRENA